MELVGRTYCHRECVVERWIKEMLHRMERGQRYPGMFSPEGLNQLRRIEKIIFKQLFKKDLNC